MAERKKKKRNTRNVKSADQYFDYSMLAVLIFMICFGLVMLFSTSSYSALIKQGDSMFYLKRQLIFCGWFLGNDNRINNRLSLLY